MNTDKVVSIAKTAAWRRGVKLAIELLEEIEEKWAAASLQELPESEDDPQVPAERLLDDVLLRFMHRARDAGELAERAFAAVLGDVLVDNEADLQALEHLALDAATVRRCATPAAAGDTSRAIPIHLQRKIP